MRSNSLIYGAAILFAANFINRILGFGYQYLIMRYIGSESYGLFHMVFPVYMTALVLTTAGIPLAISKMVSEKVSVGYYHEARKIFRIAFFMLFITGFIVSAFLYLNASWVVNRFFADARVLLVFKICVPAIFIVSIASAFRGYFQGMQNMIPSALSQVSEQIFRVAIGFALSLKLLSKGIEWAAAGLAAGMLCGEIVGLIVIFGQYLIQKNMVNINRQPTASSRSIIWNLLTLSLPVTGSRLTATGLSALDAFIIPSRLQVAGYSPRIATSLFGQLSGTALTLLTFPSVFTFALATSLVPAISEAMIKKDYKLAQKRCSDAIRYTIILGLPCVLGLYYYAEPLTRLFNSAEVAPVLKVMALGGIFAYLQQTTTGIIQGLGKTLLPLIHSVLSAAIRLPLLYYLTGMSQWGLMGSALAYVFGFISIAILNLMAVKRHIGMELDVKSFVLQPLTAGLGMLIMLQLFIHFIPQTPLTMIGAMGIGFIFYIIILFLIGGINPNEIKKIPFLNRILSKLF